MHNLLLQIFEDGHLTDGKGRQISFRNTIVILTSNIGAQRFQTTANAIGFSDDENDLSQKEHEFEIAAQDVMKDLKQAFVPEFVNRLDSVVVFHPLNRDAIKQIVKLQVKEFQTRLDDKKITLQIGGSTINSLAKASYHPESGARQVRRVLADKMEHPLAEGLLNGDIKAGDTLKVAYDGKTELCSFTKVTKK